VINQQHECPADPSPAEDARRQICDNSGMPIQKLLIQCRLRMASFAMAITPFDS